jgi:hypothetical protein|tara:strand:+ start:386 stop:571 length:186 start_codon:yes stop_codon:yes gene_type:complete
MEDDRIVSSAKKVNDPITGEYSCIKAVIDSVEMFVPLDEKNKERILVKAWEDSGNTIADAD